MKITLPVDVKELNRGEIAFLDRLGLSKHEILVYTILLRSSEPMSAQDVASKFMVHPSSLYRIFHDIEAAGLIRQSGKSPIRYVALEQTEGFQVARKISDQKLGVLLKSATGISGDSQIEIISSRKDLYARYIELAERAGKRIDIYAIGIAHSKKLEKVQKDALERGVRVRHIVQQRRPSNYFVLRRWSRLGVSLKYQKKDRGFHFIQIDDTTLITFSNPSDTDDRLTIATSSKPVQDMFGVSFNQLWYEAKKITV